MIIRKVAGILAVMVGAASAVLGPTAVDASASPGNITHQIHMEPNGFLGQNESLVVTDLKFIDAPPPHLFGSKQECENWVYWCEFSHPWEKWQCNEVGPNGVTELNGVA